MLVRKLFVVCAVAAVMSGCAARKIPGTDLDVPATLKANIDRGAKFSLPSRSSEVILRP